MIQRNISASNSLNMQASELAKEAVCLSCMANRQRIVTFKGTKVSYVSADKYGVKKGKW